MFRKILSLLQPAFISFILLSIITGLIYPSLMTGIAQLLFPGKANGSLTANGSLLIGQPFDANKYFWGRPSATTPFADNAMSSTPSNQALTNPAFVQTLSTRIDTIKKADPNNKAPIPADLVMASGSGLDPEISPQAAFYQAPRIARVRGLSIKAVNDLIQQHVQKRQFGILGEARVNVLILNTALDTLAGTNK